MKRLLPFLQTKTKNFEFQGFTLPKLGKNPFFRNFVCVTASPKTQ